MYRIDLDALQRILQATITYRNAVEELSSNIKSSQDKLDACWFGPARRKAREKADAILSEQCQSQIQRLEYLESVLKEVLEEASLIKSHMQGLECILQNGGGFPATAVTVGSGVIEYADETGSIVLKQSIRTAEDAENLLQLGEGIAEDVGDILNLDRECTDLRECCLHVQNIRDYGIACQIILEEFAALNGGMAQRLAPCNGERKAGSMAGAETSQEESAIHKSIKGFCSSFETQTADFSTHVREGLIKITQPQESTELEWIPSKIMQIDGSTECEQYLARRIKILNEKVGENSNVAWNQEKVDYLWEICRNYYEEYQVQIDPRMLLAIIFAEGTGSFDTSLTNKAADGGNGVEEDFKKDCEKALGLVGGKVIAYQKYGEDFRQAIEDNPEIYGEESHLKDILTYINWETPCLYLRSGLFQCGEYAEDNHWNAVVRNIYSKLFEAESYENHQADAYSDYIKGLPEDLFETIARDHGIDISGKVCFEKGKNTDGGEYIIKGSIEK